jgi:hypothetical protein
MTGTYDALEGLPLTIDGYRLENLEREVSSGFLRRTTVIHLEGTGQEGVGEDVTYTPEEHEVFQTKTGRDLPLAGEHTIASFSELLGGLDLFPAAAPEQPAFRLYRRWGLESAALDLALAQAGKPLGEVVGRTPSPVRFVVSLRLGKPSTIAPVRDRLAVYPWLRFKLDAVSDWDDDLVAELVATEAVDSVDFKGAYVGTVVDQPPDPALYRRVVEAFPDAWLEDPKLTRETLEALDGARDRVTWDAPIHSVADIDGLPFPPRTVNIKPSRFGSLEALTAAYDYCDANGIGAYGGGQFELGPGRGHIQYLASLFHADAPNDIAPGGFNDPEIRPGLPESPLPPAPARVGFRWDSA